ncbi:MAG: rod shape-determining protein MreD [Alphaproteobacteria bacterium]
MWTEQFSMVLRLCVPYAVFLVLFVLNLVPFSLSLSASVEIPFVIMAIYYWSIYRPTFIPPFAVFILGMCFDLLSAMPVGLNSLIFLIIRHVVSQQRLFLTGQPFLMIWLGFVLVSCVALVLQWGLFGLIQFSWPPFMPVLLMWGSGVLCFPLIVLMLMLAHKVLPDVPDQYSAVK